MPTAHGLETTGLAFFYKAVISYKPLHPDTLHKLPKSAKDEYSQHSVLVPINSLFIVGINQVVFLGVVDDDRSDLATLENAPLPR